MLIETKGGGGQKTVLLSTFPGFAVGAALMTAGRAVYRRLQYPEVQRSDGLTTVRSAPFSKRSARRTEF